MDIIFDLENTVGYLVNRCAILLKNELTHRFNQAGYDITPEEWVILNRLWEQDGMSQNELAERTIKDKTTITRFLNQMEAKGLVTRRSSQVDGRYKNIYLTTSGRESKPDLIKIAHEMLFEAAIGLSNEDIQTTLNSLKRIENNVLSIEKTRK